MESLKAITSIGDIWQKYLRGVGHVYKGTTRDGKKQAVVKVLGSACEWEKLFLNEVKNLKKISPHKHSSVSGLLSVENTLLHCDGIYPWYNST